MTYPSSPLRRLSDGEFRAPDLSRIASSWHGTPAAAAVWTDGQSPSPRAEQTRFEDDTPSGVKRGSGRRERLSSPEPFVVRRGPDSNR